MNVEKPRDVDSNTKLQLLQTPFPKHLPKHSTEMKLGSLLLDTGRWRRIVRPGPRAHPTPVSQPACSRRSTRPSRAQMAGFRKSKVMLSASGSFSKLT